MNERRRHLREDIDATVDQRLPVRRRRRAPDENGDPVSEAEFVDVTGVRELDGYLLELEWADGIVTSVDAEPYLHGPAFDPLRDPAVFATVTVDAEAGTVVWPNGADISPEELRRVGRPVTAAVPAEPTASRAEVLAARERLRRLAAEHRLSNVRVDATGAVVLTLPADDPGYR